MQNNLTIVNAPSPVNTTGTFTLNLPRGSFAVETTSNSVSFLCFTQGTPPPPENRTFMYVSPPYQWDDEADTTPYNFVAWVVIAQGTYAILEKWR
jgi:hypothetical protein